MTDSAASSTAYLSGVKGNQATIGVDARVTLADCNAMNTPQYHTSSILKDFQVCDRCEKMCGKRVGGSGKGVGVYVCLVSSFN